jgi:hypothetical protein
MLVNQDFVYKLVYVDFIPIAFDYLTVEANHKSFLGEFIRPKKIISSMTGLVLDGNYLQILDSSTNV